MGRVRLPSFDNDIVFAGVSHVTFVVVYLMEVRVNPLLFATPLGTESAAVFLAVTEILVMTSTTRRLGILQAVGVIATSYALVLSISYQSFGALQSALGKAATMVAAALVFRFAPKAWPSRTTFLVAFYAGLQADLVVYALGVGLPSIIWASLPIEGVMFLSVWLGMVARDHAG